MRPDAPPPTSVDEYIARCEPTAQKVMKQVRRVIRKALPGAEEVISYQIPAYKLNGRIVVYVAAWRKHYSVYPFSKQLESRFKREIAKYETSGRGTIRFPLSEPVPTALIEGIATFRAAEVARATALKTRAKTASAKKTMAKSSRR